MSKQKLERWMAIPDFPNYFASDMGRVMSCMNNKVTVLNLKTHINKYRYEAVLLNQNTKKRMCRVHVLVLSAFCGPRANGQFGCHLDDVRLNNQLENLAWASPHENVRQALANKRYLQGSNHPMSKLTEEQREEIRRDYRRIHATSSNARELAARYGVTTGAIVRVVFD